MAMRIPMSRPSVGDAELRAVEEVLASGWLGEGPRTAEFESALAAMTGALYVVAVSTGTAALHLALEVLGVGPGDEVIVPALTFVSDPMVVHWCGATPVFAEVSASTLTLDPARLEQYVTARTKVIVPTDYAGLPADVPAIRQALGDRPIRVVRDAAHSFGSRIHGRLVGLGEGEDATCFSFDPIKNLTCGEGGAVLVPRVEDDARLRRVRTLGFSAGARPRSSGSTERIRGVTERGYRYHMSDLNAAIGLGQLTRFEQMAARKRQVARLYDERLAGIAAVTTFARDYDAVLPFIYPIRVPASRRDSVIAHMVAKGIHADLRYPACHQEPFFGQAPVLPVTEAVVAELLCLPIYADMRERDVDEVVDELGAALK